MANHNPYTVGLKSVVEYLEGLAVHESANLQKQRDNNFHSTDKQKHRLEIAKTLLQLAKKAYKEKNPGTLVQQLLELPD